MAELEVRATELLKEFKADHYSFGSGVLEAATGKYAADLGKRIMFVGRTGSPWFQPIQQRILQSLGGTGVDVVGVVKSAAPNAPFVDVYRIHGHIMHKKPDAIVVADGGSGTDGVKPAAVLATLGDIQPEIDPFFGVGEVTKMCQESGRKIMPIVAVMLTASSGAHLTKYSNITDPVLGQKKLIVDDAIIPPRAVFDYDMTTTQPMNLTLDGGLDGMSHCLEVYFGAAGESRHKVEEIAEIGIELIVKGLTKIKEDPTSREARLHLGMGTDLGGYAIMVGGTSGPHLNSFSLIDVLSHGRACALMNPYYVVFFAPAIQEQLRVIGGLLKKYGFVKKDPSSLSGRELGLTVAEGMVNFSRFLDFPTRLQDVSGVTEGHIERCIEAAKNPQLEMKLRNMPVPLNATLVDAYMRPILEAAWSGRFDGIKNLEA